MLKLNFRRVLFLVSSISVLAIAAFATACTGPAGPAGAPGSAAVAPGSGVAIKITAVNIPADRKPVVTFKLTDTKGNPLKVEDLDGTPPLPSFTIAKLVEADGLSHYENYISRTVTGTAYLLDGKTTQAAQPGPGTQPSVDSGGKVAVKGPGEYIFTFGQTIPQEAYAASATHLVGAYATRQARAYVSNDVFTFVPAGGEPKSTRMISSTKTCNQCHDPLGAHGGTRRDFGLCITCHTPQNVDPETGNTVDMKVMVHKIHDGKDLPSVVSGKPYIIIGHQLSVHNYSEIGWPQDVRNCTTCHQDAPQADNWKTKPSAAACGSCHDDVDFKTGTNHPGGPQQDDKTCGACHPAEGAEYGPSVVGAHTLPTNSSQLTGLTAEIVKVTDTAPGQKPVVTFNLKDGKGNPVDPSDLFSLAVTMAHPTTDYQHRNTETIRRAGSPATATAAAVAETPSKAVKNADSTYSYTLTTTVDPTWTGSLAVGMEGYKNTTIKGSKGKDTVVRESFYNPVAYAAVTDAKPVARRGVISRDNCNSCHKDLGNPAGISIHGGNRRNTEYCLMCHNPTLTDEPTAPRVKGFPTESVQFKYMIHAIHEGEERAVPAAFGGRAQVKTEEIFYPGDQRNCNKCHVGTTYTLPLPTGVLPTALTPAGLAGKTMLPITATCTGCHASASAAGHFALNTTAGGQETCAVCHSQTADFGMTKVHARP